MFANYEGMKGYTLKDKALECLYNYGKIYT